jgi:hypothetical protein
MPGKKSKLMTRMEAARKGWRTKKKQLAARKAKAPAVVGGSADASAKRGQPTS